MDVSLKLTSPTLQLDPSVEADDQCVDVSRCKQVYSMVHVVVVSTHGGRILSGHCLPNIFSKG